jgi:hypothetical protein
MKKSWITTMVILLVVGTFINMMLYLMVCMMTPPSDAWGIATLVAIGATIVAIIIHDRHMPERIV